MASHVVSETIFDRFDFVPLLFCIENLDLHTTTVEHQSREVTTGVTSTNLVTLGHFLTQRMALTQRLRPGMRAERPTNFKVPPANGTERSQDAESSSSTKPF